MVATISPHFFYYSYTAATYSCSHFTIGVIKTIVLTALLLAEESCCYGHVSPSSRWKNRAQTPGKEQMSSSLNSERWFYRGVL